MNLTTDDFKMYVVWTINIKYGAQTKKKMQNLSVISNSYETIGYRMCKKNKPNIYFKKVYFQNKIIL